MTKYAMHRYLVSGTAEVVHGKVRLWTREVNATNANDAKWAAKSDWAREHGHVRLTNVTAKRIGIPGFNLSGWKEA